MGAIGDSYATAGDYREIKGGTSPADDSTIQRQLSAISRVLDRKLGYPATGFNKDSSVTTRIYGPRDEIAPIASATGLIIKAATGHDITWNDVTALVESEDYELLPLNALADGFPVTEIRLHGWSLTPPSRFTPQTYRPDDWRVQVTAIHGWPSVPDAIWWATIELTAIARTESPYATMQINEMDRTMEASPQARAILRDLSRVYARYPVAVG